MPNFELVSLDEALIKSSLAGKRGEVMKEYLGYINRLVEGQAGKLQVSNEETPAAVRRRLGAASKLAGKALVIKRVGDEIFFWLEPRDAGKGKRGRKRRRQSRTSEA